MTFKLIYVNKLGFNHKGNGLYELIFSDEGVELEEVWGDGWEATYAQGNAQPPEEDCICKVGLIQCKDYELSVAHESEAFGLRDAKDNVIALAWELIDEDFDPKKQRLVLQFGEDLVEIEKRLKKRGIKINYEEEEI